MTNGQSNLDLGIEDNKEGLTEVGIIEARQLALTLKNQKVNYIYCSPALRCEQTMQAILSEKEDDKDISVSFSRLIAAKTIKEELTKLKARVNVFIDDMTFDHLAGEVALAITHKSVAEMMVFILSGEHINVDQASISIFEIAGGERAQIKANDTDHLRG